MNRLIFLLAALYFIPLSSRGQISVQRIEPMFWWTGMENKNLQLMVYGENISKTTVGITYPGVFLERVSMVQNPNYLFVDLIITDEAQSGSFDISFREENNVMTSYTYKLLERKPNSKYRQGFDSSDAIYLIMPDRFSNGNPENDKVNGMIEGAERGIPDMRHGGDIEGIINHLDYIREMGFTSLWLTPVLESNQPEYSYHGYAITDFYRVDPRFGNNQKYKQMVEEANKRGIKIIKDLIFNHCSHKHWWMNDLPSPDWINNMPETEYTITNHRKTLTMDPYRSQIDLEQLTDGWFVTRMPDLNQKNEHLATYLIQNSIWWIEYAGLSGIRMDTYPYPDKYMMSEWTCRIKKEYPNFTIVGEEMSANPTIVSYWQEHKMNPDGYQSCLPSLMDFPLRQAIIDGLIEEEDWFTGLMRMYEGLAMDFLYPDPYDLVVLTDNHDLDRVFTSLNEDMSLWKMAMSYLLTIRGIPQIYYGTEILMTGLEHEGHGTIRKDFPGGWPGDKVNAFTGEGLIANQKEAQKFLKKLLHWRQKQEVIHSGKLKHFVPHDGVYVFFRYNDDKTIMVVLNKNHNETNIDIKRYNEVLHPFSNGTDVLNNKQVSLDGLTMPARSAIILDLIE